MQEDEILLTRALMQNAAAYFQRGLIAEAAVIMSVAEEVEFGSDAFCEMELDNADGDDTEGH